MPALREIVKARARAAGLSLNEVERRARWSPGTLSRVLRVNMTLASLERIAAALGCPAWELLRDAASDAHKAQQP
ncbi:helix-turn-helix domain-containing protein [Variovorax paradoxus]|uniref:helix-turn-helix domain-containing protein n=1 Tax=Variovorax paradoxus TaxID=34073 RepID=UPI003D651086